MDVLEKVSRAIASDYGITVTFSGTQAYTDCKHINLPYVPQELVNEESIDMLRGYCDHEIAHVLFSSSTMLTEPFFVSSPKEVVLLTGVIEDIRVEKKMGTKYSGARVNMQRLCKMLLPKTDLEHPIGALLIEGRRQVVNYDLDTPSHVEKLKKAFKDDELFSKIAATDSSMDSYNLALELLKKMQEEPPPQPQEDDKDTKEDDKKNGLNDKTHNKKDKEEEDVGKDGDGSDGEGDDDGDERDDGGDRGDEGSDEGDDEGAGEGKSSDEKKSDDGEAVDEEADSKGGDEKSDADEIAQGNKDASGAVSDGNDAYCLVSDDFANPLDNVLSELKNDINRFIGSGAYIPFTTSYDKMEVVKEFIDCSGRYESRMYEGMKESFGHKLGALRAKISSQFNARVAGNWLLGKDKGRINNRALAGVTTGRRDVFKERYICDDVDTAITFLIDFSGSMCCKNKIETAMKTTMMFCEILRDTKVKFEILGFTSGVGIRSFDSNIMRAGDIDQFSRNDTLVTFVFKTFEEPMTATIKRRISNWHNLEKRNNYDGESLMIAFKRIMRRKEKRKIMFVLSDGKPCPMGSGNQNGSAYLKKVTKLIEEKSPVELIGIGFLSHEVREFYKTYILVDKVKELPEVMEKELKRVLHVAQAKG